MTTNFENIEFKIENRIAHITLNRPQALNALDASITRELKEAIHLCKSDEVKVVLLSGNGKGFSSGGDIKFMTKLDPKGLGSLLENLHETVIDMRNLEKPIVAAINGFAYGAGFSLALASDFRIASQSSTYSCAFVNIGLVPDSGASFFLTKLLGYARATELMMLGENIDANQALALGLVTKVVSDEELKEVALKYAEALTKKPSGSLGMIKRMVNRAIISDLPDQLALEAMLQVEAAKSPDFKEGITAFIEKRKPNFN